MTKQELAKTARLMYDLQTNCTNSRGCACCSMYIGTMCIAKLINGDIPMRWNIEEENVLRLERESAKQEFWKKLGSVFENYDIPCEKCPAFKSIKCNKLCEQALKATYEQLERGKNDKSKN